MVQSTEWNREKANLFQKKSKQTKNKASEAIVEIEESRSSQFPLLRFPPPISLSKYIWAGLFKPELKWPMGRGQRMKLKVQFVHWMLYKELEKMTRLNAFEQNPDYNLALGFFFFCVKNWGPWTLISQPRQMRTKLSLCRIDPTCCQQKQRLSCYTWDKLWESG